MRVRQKVRRHDFRDDDFIPRRFGATADGGRALVVPSKIRRKRSYTTLYLFSDSYYKSHAPISARCRYGL